MSYPEKALQHALLASAAAAGCAITVTVADWTRWSSATFTGARHTLTLSAEGSPTLQDWLANIGNAELDLRGHLLADLAVEATEAGDTVAITLHALTVEER